MPNISEQIKGNYMELYKYTELAIGIQNRGNIITVEEYPAILQRLRAQGKDEDIYVNTLLFDANFPEYVKRRGTVAGYLGPAYMHSFPLDIDADNLQKALKDLRNILAMLEYNGVPVEMLRIYFSGRKGFHLVIPNSLIGSEPGDYVSRAMRIFAEKLFTGFAYDTTIYNHVRLFRAANTRHGKTGLYKVPLTLEEAKTCTVDQILELAQKPRNIRYPVAKETNPFLQNMWQEAVKLANKHLDVQTYKGVHIPALTDHYCYRSIFENGAEEGLRNSTLLRAAFILRKAGLPYEQAMEMLQQWNEEKLKPPLPTKEVENTVRSEYEKGYDFGCNDPILQKHCSPLCPLYSKLKANKAVLAEIYDMHSLAASYISFLHEYETRRIPFCYPAMDKVLTGLMPAFLVYILARSGVGKTTFLVDLMYRIEKHYNFNLPVVFFSLEMDRRRIFERFVARHTGMSATQMYELYRQDKEKLKQMFDEVAEKLKRIIVVDKTGLSIPDLYRYIHIASDKVLAERPAVVFIDYLTLLRVENMETASPYMKASKLAVQLQEFAKEIDMPVVVVTQANRQAGSGAEDVDMSMARDSGVIEETADLMLGMWRKAGEQDTLRIKVLKNRYGISNISFVAKFDFATQHIYELVPENVANVPLLQEGRE